MKNRNFYFLFFILTMWSNCKSQSNIPPGEVQANFTYLLDAKVNNKYPDKSKKELFYLQITDSKAYFSSSLLSKRDSITQSVRKNVGGMVVIDYSKTNMPKTLYKYVIVQKQKDVSYFQPVGLSLFYYKDPVINNWELINETKNISNWVCKKASVYFKGRKWIAWYSPEIPLQYGPYKFSGLPGLIVKITDENEEYDFQLVESKSLARNKGHLYLRETRYTKAKETTQLELENAIDNLYENAGNSQMVVGAIINSDPNLVRDRREKYIEFKRNYNTIEL